MVDIRALAHNRLVWVGAAGAGALGIAAFIRNRRGGGGSSGAAAGAAAGSPAYSSGAVGSFDTTSTDVAGWLSSYQTSLDETLSQALRSIDDRLAQLPSAGVGYYPGTGGGVISNDPYHGGPTSGGVIGPTAPRTRPAPIPGTVYFPSLGG